MSRIWFLYTNEIVTGPFSAEEVRAKMSSGVNEAQSFIWCKGEREWMPLNDWERRLPEILKATQDRNQRPVWYIDQGHASPLGPLTEPELMTHLKGIVDLARVHLWASGMEKWTIIYDIPEIMDQLGINRRENQRAPLMGSVAVTRSNEAPKGYVLKAASISVAGIGVTGDHDLRRGDEVTIMMKSQELNANIHARGQVAYVMTNGYVGIRFHEVHQETQSILLDYVKRFHSTAGRNNAPAA